MHLETHHCLQKYLERGGRFGQGQSAEKGCNDPSELGLAWVGELVREMTMMSRSGKRWERCGVQLACYMQQDRPCALQLAEGV